MDASHNTHELQPTNLEAAVAVMAVELRYVRAGVDELKAGQNLSVSRNEWEQRNGYVDSRFGDMDKELAARRVPWTSVGALVIASAVLIIDLIQRVGP